MQTLFLVGPTAVGKSAVALDLATRLGGEIVSADSMQVYRGMDIGTAKPSAAEQAAVRHHLLDVADPTEHFDTRQFVDLATNAIRSIHQRGKVALVVGGTGLYVRSLRQGLFDGPARDPALRAKLELMSRETLFAELQRVDPATAARIDRHNPRRLVRALEVFYSTGTPISALQRQWQPSPETAPAAGPRARVFGLDRDRADLHARIERRIDAQLAAAWLDEVRRLRPLQDVDIGITTSSPRKPRVEGSQDVDIGISTSLPAWQAAGYRELAAHLRGELTLVEAVTQIKAKTRQLAKRQLTWFRKEPGLIWLVIDRDEPPSRTADRIMEQLRKEQEVSA